jgi:hypothetical protein
VCGQYRNVLDLFEAHSAADTQAACKPKMQLAGRMGRAKKCQDFSWEQPDVMPPDVGSYDYAHGLIGRQTHASRLTMPPGQYAAWQQSLNQSPSAQKAQQQLVDVSASGCHLGHELRLNLLKARHTKNWKAPPRALEHTWPSNGIGGFQAECRHNAGVAATG